MIKNENLFDIKQFAVWVRRMLMVPADTEKLINEIQTITEVKPMLTKIADQIRAEGRTEGKLEGKVEGRLEGEHGKAREDASRMLDKGYPIEDICDITSLSREEVESLRKQ